MVGDRPEIELAVALPEQVPGDDEDVVWGLSTASALWARGELDDAVVWLRRAADAAIAAGQDFRASQLGMAAAEVDDALSAWRRSQIPDAAVAPSAPEPSAIAAELPQEDPVAVSPPQPAPFASPEPTVRAPILDPWLEGPSGDVPALARKLPPPPALSVGGSMLVDIRTRPTSDEEGDVVSSAPPLAIALARKAIPPKPPPPPKLGNVDRAHLPKPRPPQSAEAPEARVGEFSLGEILAFADLPHPAQAQLAATARIERLGPDEEVSGFAAALLLDGPATVYATIVDVPALQLEPLTLVPSRGTLAETIALRVVAGGPGARVAVWSPEHFDAALASCPWVQTELHSEADRFQALAGATMGAIGDLDEATRQASLPRLSVRVIAPGELVADRGVPSLGLAVVGLGAIHVGDSEVLTPGDLLFPSTALDGSLTPAAAYAGAGGALLLVADRPLASALFAELPAMLELVSRS